jgi:hypothetical protein
MAQTAAVMAALAAELAPLDSASLAARFRRGRRSAAKIGSVLGVLERMGFVTPPTPGAASACAVPRSVCRLPPLGQKRVSGE